MRKTRGGGRGRACKRVWHKRRQRRNNCIFFCCGRRKRTRQRYEDSAHSHLGEHLLEQAGRSDISCKQLQDTGHKAILDGADNDVMRAIESLGAGGAQPQNAERDLHRWARDLFNCSLEPQTLKLMLDMPDSETSREVEVGILPMHEVLHAIANAGELQFEMSLVGPDGEEGISRLWQYAQQYKWGQDAGDNKEPAWR
eukprot:6073505-Pyramimonas_sp.AAC.1